MSNISLFLCQYHIHDEVSQEYTTILSSAGNNEIKLQNTKLSGSDTIQESKCNFFKFKPIKNSDGEIVEIQCTHVMWVVPDNMPQMIQNKIAGEHQVLL